MRADGISRFLSGVLISLSFWPCTLMSQRLELSPGRPLAEASARHGPPLSGITRSVLETLPLQFEENKGQADRRAQFLARAPGYTLFLNSDGLVLNLSHAPNSTARGVSMHLLGAEIARPIGLEQTVTQTNYYLGSDPHNWHLAVPSYRSVMYAGIYKGIDLIYHGGGSELEYDFVISPGADPSQIRTRFEGFKPLLHGKDLSFEGQDQLSVKSLKAYQVLDGKKIAVDADWEIQRDQASIRLGPYDRGRELIIDPIFFYGTYIGGNGADDAVSVVKGAQQDQYYVAMSTSSMALDQPPPQPNVSNPTNPNCSGGTCGTDTIILEIQATTTDIPEWGIGNLNQLESVPVTYPTIISASYLGGTQGTTKPTSMTADNNFNLYVTGSTTNPDGLPQLGSKICSDNCTGYVAKFSPTLAMTYSLALSAVGNGIAVDANRNTYITGMAAAGSLAIPPSDVAFESLVTNGSAMTSGTHAYLLELGPTGALLFASFIGGSGVDEGKAVAVSVDSTTGDAKTVYVSGRTSSTDFPTQCAACQTNFGGGSGDAFVLAISNLPATPVLDYSTYLGGSGDDSSSSIAVDAAGNVVLVGSTTSTDFPKATAQPAFQFSGIDMNGNLTAPVNLPDSVPPGSQDGFVTGLSLDGTLRFTDFLGGSDSTASITIANAVVLDQVGVIYVTGTSNANIATTMTSSSSTAFLAGTMTKGPTTTDNWNLPPPSGSSETDLTNNHVFFAQIDPNGQQLLQATIAGGFADDQAESLSVAGYCFPPRPPPSDPKGPFYPPCVGTASIVGSTGDSSLFDAASSTFLYAIDPSPSKAPEGFFVQEQLAGYCSMQVQQQLGSSLSLAGPCVSGTLSGTTYFEDKAGNLVEDNTGKIVTANVTISGAGTLAPSASLSLDLSKIGGMPPYTLIFSFLPLGAIGAVGSCTLLGGDTGTINGCPPIPTGGGGAGTIFNVTSGALSVVLSCPGPECQYNNMPNTVVVGRPVTLNAVVTNGIPKTVLWSSADGTFGSDTSTPSTSITFTPGGSGGSVTVKARPVVDLSLTPVPSITLSTVNLVASGGPVSITSKVTQLVAGTTYQFQATSGLVTWTASAGTIDSSTGDFTAPNPPPAPAQITITATSTANVKNFDTKQITIIPAPALVAPASITVPAGGSASIPISITAGTGIAGESITLACSPATLPTGVSCSFTPNPVINSAGGATATLQLFSNNRISSLPMRGNPWEKYPINGSAIVITGCIFVIGCKNRGATKMTLVASALAIATLMSLAACGTGGSFHSVGSGGSQATTGTFTIDLTATGTTSDAADDIQVLTTVPLKVTIQ